MRRKELERRAGTGVNANEFWWGVGENGTAQSVNLLLTQHGAKGVIFSAIKNQKQPNAGLASDILVWRKYRMLGGKALHDIPKHVLITSAMTTNTGKSRETHFALVCKSSNPLKIGGAIFEFSNPHYKNLLKNGALGRAARGQRTTTALVKWTNNTISHAECDGVIDFYADFSAPFCVELCDLKKVPSSLIANLNRQIAHGLQPSQWVPAISLIRG